MCIENQILDTQQTYKRGLGYPLILTRSGLELPHPQDPSLTVNLLFLHPFSTLFLVKIQSIMKCTFIRDSRRDIDATAAEKHAMNDIRKISMGSGRKHCC